MMIFINISSIIIMIFTIRIIITIVIIIVIIVIIIINKDKYFCIVTLKQSASKKVTTGPFAQIQK